MRVDENTTVHGSHVVVEASPRKSEKLESIAIVGMAARLPQDAVSIEEFWTLLYEGRRAASDIPKDRINMDAFYHPNSERSDTTNVRRGHFLEGDIAAFDAPFFSIKPIEAESMDPQQRLLLETSYRALENAGIPMESAAGSKAAVFFAASTRDFEVMLYRDPELAPKYMGTGIGTSLLANRVSWFFDLLGPSVTIDTACSGSLTAVHLACQSLRNHECSMALAGGGSLILAPEVSMSQLSTLGFLSPDGRSYSFDFRANGYGKGEGLGMMVLKRMDDAIRDGDTIRAVIRSTAINQDGRTPGITQPSIKAQTDNIKQAYQAADLSLEYTRYFEAHGTGTAVGDPFEAEAIHTAFQRKLDNPLYIGTLKASIGHLEAGAGIAAMIKSVLILENGILPPNAGFERHNPAIPVEDWSLRFLKSAIPFPDGELRRISVNSFGYGGTNAHAILDDAYNHFKMRGYAGNHSTRETSTTVQHGTEVSGEPNPSVIYNAVNEEHHMSKEDSKSCLLNRKPIVLLFSAADEAGVKRLADTYENHFSRVPTLDRQAETKYLANLAYTLSSRRSKLPWKGFSVVGTLEHLQAGFATTLSKPLRSSTPPSISYIFTGQGVQWYAMAHGLTVHPVFSESLQRSQEYLIDQDCEWILIDELHKGKETSRVDEPELSQPLCTALQIALVDLLMSWQLRPAAVIGHSSGEIAAAYCIGALSHESAIRVAYHRGRVAASISSKRSGQGTMIAVGLSEEDIATHLEEAMVKAGGRLSVGCVNAPENVTVTGDVPAIEALGQMMYDSGTFARKLQVPVAYHSYHMEDLADEYLSKIQKISSNAHEAGFANAAVMFSSVTGKRATSREVGIPEYWVNNLISKVSFSQALSQMASYLLEERGGSNKCGKDILLEIGPHSALQRPTKDTIKEVPGAKDFDYDSTLSRDTEPSLALANAIGRLCCRGCLIDLATVSSPNIRPTEFQTLPNLPPYPFNHSQSYWTESRISKNFRFREHARHELLGIRETDWNPLQPKWRNVIRVSEHPWIHDHKFRGTGLYPAAAMMVMAIEAARQLTCLESKPYGYQLNDIAFPAGFVVPSDSTTMEAQLHFYPHKTSGSKAHTKYDFHIFAYLNDSWTETCSGTIAVEIQRSEGCLATRGKERLEGLGIGELLDDSFAKRWEKISSSQFYENLAACGYDLGPTFQTLDELQFTEDGQATAKVFLDNWTTKVESHPVIAHHVIHPTDLDGVFQSTVEAYSQGSRLAVPVLIPTKLKSLWISGDMLDRKPGQEIKILTKTTFRGFRAADFSIGAVNAGNRLQVLVEGFRQTALNGQGVDFDHHPRRSCYHVDWRPDVDLLSRTEIVDRCEKAVDPDKVPSGDLVDRQELVALYYMEKALAEISESRFEHMPSHLTKYLMWIKHHFDPKKLEALRKSHSENEKLFKDDASREDFLSKFAGECVEGKLMVKVGKNFVPVMNGELDALEMLFGGDNILDEYYTSAPFTPNFTRLTTYIDLVVHKNPALNILEVGAGTGSLTGAVLKSVMRYTDRTDDNDDVPRMQHYTFTDISPGFFEEAKVKFEEYSNYMSYAVLNLEKDPLDQGFETKQFDMVVASLVLHATTNLQRTLQNVRKVLSPGGRLILFEPCAPDTARVSFVFGLLPGWWLSEEKEREWCPLLDGAGWHKILLETGFSGVEVNLPDQKDSARLTFSGFISTAIEPQKTAVKQLNTILVAAERSPFQQKVAHGTQKALSADRHGVKILTPDQFFAHDLRSSHCISLLEIDSSFFEHIGEDDWSSFKKTLTGAQSMLWITKGCTMSGSQPSLALVKGLGRAIRCEDLDAHFVELALESEDSERQAVSQIVKVFRQSLLPHEGLLESEFMEQDGQLCIGRVAEATSPNLKVYNATTLRPTVREPFGSDSKRGLKLTIETPGLLETLRFEYDTLHDQQLGPTEVEIEVRASGVSFKDVLISLGQVEADVLGFECSGTVAQAGPQSGYQPGERVCACTTTGGYKTFVRTDASAVMKVPENLSLNAAAGIPTVFATVYYSLVTIANLQGGESVLIHSGAGGVGQAAIQMAQRLRARIFTTVGSEVKKKLLMELYNIPEDHIFFSRNTDFAGKVMSMTGSGVDVVLNSLSGEGQTASWSCLAPLGRFVELGKADIESPRKGLPMGPFANNVSFHSVSLDVVMDKAKPLMRRIMTAVSKLLTDSTPVVTPQPLHTYRVSEIEDAFRFMQTGGNDGKIVVEMMKSDSVPVLPTLQPAYYFIGNATYVIAGGLGGLGRSIVKWMADRKARHFLLLSRSGADGSSAARDFIEEMKARGVHILAPRCDVTDEQTVAAVIRECNQNMPPIKGCIQGSMVLKDGLLESTSASDLHAVLRPKTIGTRNLQLHMPRSLDFFVLLSSIASVTGSRGQANYSAANTFQDAFARRLAAAGQPCLSLNLGSIMSVGFAAERNLTAALRRDGFEGVSKAEFLALLDWACDPGCAAARDPRTAQLISGLAGAETLPAALFRDVYWTSKPMFRPLLQLSAVAQGAGAGSAKSAAQDDFASQLAGAAEAVAAKGAALAALVDRLARLLAVPREDIDPCRPILLFGIDSLIALELRQWIGKELRAEMSIFDIMQGASVEELAAKVVERSELTLSIRKL